MFSYDDYKKSADCIKEKINGLNPKIAIILGSGLGGLANEIKDSIIIPYNNIVNFPASTVEGHAGELIIGKLNGKEIIAMNRKISLLRRI